LSFRGNRYPGTYQLLTPTFKKEVVLELVVIGSTEFLASPKVRNRYPGTYQLLTPTLKKEGVLELVVIGLTFIIYYNKLTVLTNE